MKQYILSVSLGLVGLWLGACSEDKLSDQSVIVSQRIEKTPFDKWIKAELTDPYNIRFVYRYNHNESNKNYANVPADYLQAVKLAHILKYACIEAYNDVAGKDFTKTYFPKLFYATGSFLYNPNNTMVLGTAEGGKKIFLAGTNSLDEYLKRREDLNHYYLQTIHHEFTHILNQTLNYTPDFKKITGNTYLSDSWNAKNSIVGYLQRGYISAYSQKEDREDFAELLSMYVTNTPEQWQAWMTEAGSTGAGFLAKKIEIVRNYMLKGFNIDIDKLRDDVLKREDEIVSGKVDLTDLSIKK